MLSTNPTIATLNRLIRLNLASELGFETAAEHVKNRALKLYLKRYAQQRAHFVDALHAEIGRWGGTIQVARNPLAAFHRGWIDLKAALTVGRDNEARVVLQECLSGERVALTTYAQARQAVLPSLVDDLLQQQATQIQQAHDQLCRLAECGDDALVVQFFAQPASAQAVVAHLAASGLPAEQIQMTPVSQISAYACHCQRQRLLESSSAGAVVGALAGIMLGVIIALPLLLSGEMSGRLGAWAAPLLFSILAGALGGALFGVLIGRGITEDDAYFYQNTVQNGGMIVAVQTARGQISAVRSILHSQRDQERQPVLAAAV